MKDLMSTKMSEGTSIEKRFLKMKDHLNMLKFLGAEIDGQAQADIILESLPDSFNSFILNYNMNKMNLSLAKLKSSL